MRRDIYTVSFLLFFQKERGKKNYLLQKAFMTFSILVPVLILNFISLLICRYVAGEIIYTQTHSKSDKKIEKMMTYIVRNLNCQCFISVVSHYNGVFVQMDRLMISTKFQNFKLNFPENESYTVASFLLLSLSSPTHKRA